MQIGLMFLQAREILDPLESLPLQDMSVKACCSGLQHQMVTTTCNWMQSVITHRMTMFFLLLSVKACCSCLQYQMVTPMCNWIALVVD